MLNIRLTTPEDYPELKQWWNDWRWPQPPSIELLDNLRFGIMVHNQTTNLCAGFIYFTNAKQFALMEFIISNFNVKDRKLRKQSQELLINSLLEVAKQKGAKAIFTSVRSQSLVNTYKNCGFIQGSTNTTEMICKL